MLDLTTIKEAQKRISEVAFVTPLSFAPFISSLCGHDIYLKKENLQRTGSFKLRGAFNKIAILAESNIGGIVAASAGNHAQGVAFSASHFGLKATIVMPESTPLVKVQGVRDFGAKVVLHGANYDEAYAHAMELSTSENLSFVHPFADDEVMSGQGTIALEILEEVNDIDVFVVPIGGGGLISGVAIAAKALNPNIRIIGVAAEGAPAMKESYDAKTAIDSTSVRTIADGIAVRDTSPVTLEYILKFVDEIVLVGEDEIASAILVLLEKQKLLVEGAGAVGVAALMHNKLALPKGSKVGVVVSGGNIDVTMLSLIIEKGLTKSARKMKLMVTLMDKPGSLMRFTEILRSVGANIVHIGYDRTSIDLEFGEAHVSVAIETKGEAHQAEIRDRLRTDGFSFSENS
jgi:threonine dehydratase